MTGPEHYAEAERLLVAALDTKVTSSAPVVIALAQVHATLALAAAQAAVVMDAYLEMEDVVEAWTEATR